MTSLETKTVNPFLCDKVRAKDAGCKKILQIPASLTKDQNCLSHTRIFHFKMLGHLKGYFRTHRSLLDRRPSGLTFADSY